MKPIEINQKDSEYTAAKFDALLNDMKVHKIDAATFAYHAIAFAEGMISTRPSRYSAEQWHELVQRARRHMRYSINRTFRDGDGNGVEGLEKG